LNYTFTGICFSERLFGKAYPCNSQTCRKAGTESRGSWSSGQPGCRRRPPSRSQEAVRLFVFPGIFAICRAGTAAAGGCRAGCVPGLGELEAAWPRCLTVVAGERT
jgi:hypothetical protein